MNYGSYWTNLISNSLISGLISIAGYNFGQSSQILKDIGWNDIFAGITVWVEFAFSYLSDATKEIFKQLAEIIRKRLSWI